jgi:hypothetical protein
MQTPIQINEAHGHRLPQTGRYLAMSAIEKCDASTLAAEKADAAMLAFETLDTEMMVQADFETSLCC